MSATIGEIVKANPPRCISAFRKSEGEVERVAHAVHISFRLACPQCGQSRFSLYEEAVPDSWPRAVGVTCKQCFGRFGLFETHRHGYDGELDHLGPPKEPFHVQAMTDEGGMPLEASVLTVAFTFNTALPEMQEIAAETGKPVQDLFDWFTIHDGDRPLWDWECA